MIPVALLLALAAGASPQTSDLPAGTRVITPGGTGSASPAAPPPGRGEEEPPAPAPAAPGPLRDLAWLTGHWIDDSDGARSEEIWTAPHGDSMVGVWRLSRGGTVRVIEVLAIGVEQGGAVLRLRHFDRALAAREGKEAVPPWPLVRSGRREAVFERVERAGRKPTRLTYKSPDPETLVAILEKDGRAQEFRFRRR
jgi:hypothetical protein